VLRYNTHRIADHVALLEKAAADDHGRVRLEAIVAASWLPNIEAAKKIVAIASAKPLDEWSQNAAKTAADRLAGVAEKPQLEYTVVPAPAHLSDAAKKQFIAGQEVYFREGSLRHLPPARRQRPRPRLPPIANSPWVTQDRDRLIKIVLYGLIGPLEVNGVKYDGQVPMTPFGGMLKDEEIANVLTYVRNHFGNQAAPVSPAEVKAVRDATKGRFNFYSVEELLKEHPMK
jgi:hypothetical protein